MTKEFKYCENPEAEVPRMFIDKEIGGKDADGNSNIDGHLFLKELMYLSDVLGKSKIEVWINSPGGIVTEGQSIYAAILESKANVDTICYGIAASIAGVDFQAGRKRIMMDYATLMYHPAYSDDGRKDKGLEALNKAICTMIAKRSGKSEDEIWGIMNRGRMDDKGTWISAAEALEMGFCDEVRHSDAKNEIDLESSLGLWKAANKVHNRVEQTIKPKRMKNVFNKLGLNEDANETSAIAVIDALNKKAESAEEKYNKKCEEMDALNAEMKDLKNAMEEEKKAKAKADEEAKAKADEEAKNAATAAEEVKNKAIESELTSAVTVGRIKNDAKVIESFKNMLVKDFDGTKAIIDSLPLNKVAPVFVPEVGEELTDSPVEAAARKNGITPGTAKWYNYIKMNTK